MRLHNPLRGVAACERRDQQLTSTLGALTLTLPVAAPVAVRLCTHACWGYPAVAVVLVNALDVSGPGWDWMHHTAWDGLHLADLVWPIFLFVMGACMACACVAAPPLASLRSRYLTVIWSTWPLSPGRVATTMPSGYV